MTQEELMQKVSNDIETNAQQEKHSTVTDAIRNLSSNESIMNVIN